MTVELVNPEGLPTPQSYSQLAIATGSRLVFVSGQVAEAVDETVVAAGDLRGQARVAFANVVRALAAAGASPKDVARITIYVVGDPAPHLEDISAARVAAFGEHRPADTLLGVQALAVPGHLIEVEAVAVLG